MIVGFIGLGNMGHNLALNLSDKGYKLCVYNRTTWKTEKLVKEDSSIIPFYSIKDLVDNMKDGPRVFILMISAGKAVDIILDELDQYLNSEDIVIDGGNSFFKDTIHRQKHKFNFVGMGVSGGEYGARHGPSIMVGCDENAWKKVEKILCDISATSMSGEKCCRWFGSNGAGHFVKMVHNGIEYCDMGSLSESYHIFRNLGYDNMKISEIYEQWNKGELDSYLLDICSKILKKRENGEFVNDKIVDAASQKGTGKECVVSGIELSIAIPTIVDSTFSRLISSRKKIRESLSKKITEEDICGGNEMTCDFKVDSCCFEKALLLCRCVAFIQGFNLLKKASVEYSWNINMEDICEVWSNGCIIRSRFLKQLKNIVKEVDEDFELSDTFVNLVKANIGYLKKVVIFCVSKGISVPTMSSCLNYLLGMTEERGSACLIQGMRDYFGGHTVEIFGEKENRHIEWDE